MPNILLTDSCNRSCPYCFAKPQVELGTTRVRWELSGEDLDVILGYLDPRRDQASLIGGEPTLHSRYPEIVARLLGEGFSIKVFTNGTLPSLREALPPGLGAPLSATVNLNPPETYPAAEWNEIEANLAALGDRAHLSFNIYRPDFDWGYIREAILAHNLRRSVRLGLTQPVQGNKNNACLGDDEVRETCRRIVEMAEDLAPSGISLGFDCGFRACAFTPEERGILAECGAQLLFVCRPVLDIGKDLQVWRCFPFSSLPGVRLTDFATLTDVIRHFDERWEAERQHGNMPGCPTCDVRLLGGCAGGCLSRTLNQLGKEGADG